MARKTEDREKEKQQDEEIKPDSAKKKIRKKDIKTRKNSVGLKKKDIKKIKGKKKRGRKYIEKKKLVDKEKYLIKEAIKLLKETSIVKFDASCEGHINLNIDPKKADQSVRGTVSLPYGTGKEVKIAAFVTEDRIKTSLQAGALKAGSDDLIAEVEKGKIDFDIAVAMPEIMRNLGKVGKILGQKGMMPNPKAGTISQNIEQTISELKKGRIEFRADQFGIVHFAFGKVSFKSEELENNLKSLIKAVLKNKPDSVKGKYIKNITLSTTMGPGIKLDIKNVVEETEK